MQIQSYYKELIMENFKKAHHQFIDGKTGEYVDTDPMIVKADGKDYQLYEDIQPNGDVQYCIQVQNEYGEVYMKRCPKHLLDQVRGREIVSDVALFSDVDMHQPSIQETIARFEGAVKEGFFDGELTDDEFDDDDYITEYEERSILATKRLEELRLEKSKELEGKQSKSDKDMKSERAKAVGIKEEAPADDIKQVEEA